MRDRMFFARVYTAVLSSLILISINTLNAQDYYTRQWNRVQELESAALPRQALNLTDSIHARAVKEQNDPQRVKAAIQKMRLLSLFEEEPYLHVISFYEREIASTAWPIKQVFQSLLAEVYWRHFSDNQYHIMGRTPLDKPVPDPRLWDASVFVDVIQGLYLESLQPATQLFSSSVRDFSTILDTAEGSELLRPSLYDLLLHRAMEFFTSGDAILGLPVLPPYPFQPDFFSDGKAFQHVVVPLPHRPESRILSLFQEATRLHHANGSAESRVDLELNRMTYLQSLFSSVEGDRMYRGALHSMLDQYQKQPVSTAIAWRLAQDYQRTASIYDPLGDDREKWDLKQAYTICEKAYGAFPASFYAPHCRRMMQEISLPGLWFSLQQGIPSGKEALLLLRFKNIQLTEFRIVGMDPEQDKQIQQFQNLQERLNTYMGLPAVHLWQIQIPDDGDYQVHSMELPLPALDRGYYVLVANALGKYGEEKQKTSSTGGFWVSDLAYITRQREQGGVELLITDRMTGEPKEGAIIQAHYQQYDYRSRKLNMIPGPVVSTDRDGFASLEIRQAGYEHHPAVLSIQHGLDRLVTEESYYLQGMPDPGTVRQERCFLFTDRSVYRPGQIIYFKGVLFSSDGSSHDLVKGRALDIKLLDGNGREITSQTLRTGEFGSVHGSFTAPTGILMGACYLISDYGQVSFRVESYKRPRFEVVFGPVEGEFRLGDTVLVNGKALGYAGDPIGGAIVRYRVERMSFYPYRWYGGDYIPPGTGPQSLTSGETRTNQDGSFSLTFPAIASREFGSFFKPTYRFVVHADVIDITGETRIGKTALHIGQHALFIHSEIPERIDKNAGHTYKVSVRNHQDRPVAVKLQLKIMRLQEPARMLRDRPWKRPDLNHLRQGEFVQRFPLDPWEDENNPLKWVRIEPTREKIYETVTDSLLNLNTLTALPPGYYLIELSCVDRYGDTVSRQDVIQLYAQVPGSPSFNRHLWSQVSREEAKVGNEISLLLSSGHANARFWVEVINKEGLKSRSWYSVGRGTSIIPVILSEEDKGTLVIRCVGVMDNRSWFAAHQVKVEDKTYELDVRFERFRDKSEPGSKETWQLRFLSGKGEPALAEVLLSMYDASLDAISPHAWYFQLPVKESWRVPWARGATFGTREGMSLEPYIALREPLRHQSYDKINWFGMGFWHGRGYGRGLKYGMVADDAMSMRAMTSSTMAEVAGEKADRMQDTREDMKELPGPPAGESTLIPMRRNLSETAFFYPALITDRSGDLVVRFTAPEAITRWNLLGFAHSQRLQFTSFTRSFITAKDLMLIPNLPRLFYEGDEIWLKAKVVNTGLDTLEGNGLIEMEDVITGHSVEETFGLSGVKTGFRVLPGSSDTLIWKISVPESAASLLRIRIRAESNGIADGEEHMIPVLTSRVLVTETMPLFLPGKGEKQWQFDALQRGLNDPGVKAHRLSLEFTLLPAWNVVKAIPTLIEQEGNSSMHYFNRYFAHALGHHIITTQPRVADVIRTWATLQPHALASELEKNQDLKAIILEETPWVRDAVGEATTRQQLSVLLDKNSLAHSLEQNASALCDLQGPSGAWPWFPGMQASRHMTQHILAGLEKLGVMGINLAEWPCLRQAMDKAATWVLGQLVIDLENLKRTQADRWTGHIPSSLQVHSLYALSFSIDKKVLRAEEAEAWHFFLNRAGETWAGFNLQIQALYGSAALRIGRHEKAREVVLSLRDRSLKDKDGGMYWRRNDGYHAWHEAPIETQSLLISFFEEAQAPGEDLQAMRLWLLRHKQVNKWETSTATAEACYAILNQREDWLGKRSGLIIRWGKLRIEPDKMPALKLEAGSGYFRKEIPSQEIEKGMSIIQVSTSSKSPSYGALYWQYFQDMSEVISQSGGLVLRKTMARLSETGGQALLIPYQENESLRPGDRVRVRLEIISDRDMEYVHLQDHRPASMERVTQLSGYRHQGILGWYEGIRDAATDLFFQYLPKGSHVVEYDMFVTQEGSFSSGPARIQSLYAPSFSAHTEGMRITIKAQP